MLSERGFASRWTYFIDPEGVIARIDREVDARTAGADLVEHLKVLGVPRNGSRLTRNFNQTQTATDVCRVKGSVLSRNSHRSSITQAPQRGLRAIQT